MKTNWWHPQAAGGVGGLLRRQAAANDYYYNFDHNGNIIQVTDGNGLQKADLYYSAYGKLLKGTNIQPYGFSTKRSDFKSGLIDYGYRFYMPHLKRWLNRDPIGERGGVNVYRFVGGDPVNFVDPEGLIISGTYNKNTGTLKVTNLDNGKTLSASAFSGTPGEYQPAPNGTYTLSDFPWGSSAQPNYFALLLNDGRLDDYADGHPSNYDPNKTMSNIRLHSGYVSHACVTVPSDDNSNPWLPIQQMILNTSQGTPVVIGKQKFPNYGTIQVIGTGFGSVP